MTTLSGPSDIPALECEALDVGYDAAPVVQDVSLAVAPGEFGCLLGPSGSGKSTLLRAVAGIQPVSSGCIRIGGRVVSSPGESLAPERRGVGLVFQDNALFPHLNVAGNVEFGLRARRLRPGERRGRVQAFLDLVGLTGSADQFPYELSGGQQQRVALARALAPEPGLVLLDEPFSSLDADLRERVGDEVRSILRERGITGVLVTHDQREAFALSDRIGVLNDGRLRQWDSAYNLYHRPADRFVADFIGHGVLLRGRLVAPDAVETELGIIRGSRVSRQGEPGVRRGGEVDLLLRPDDIEPAPDAKTRAVVVKRAFQGAQILYSLRLSTGSEVLSLFPSHHDHAVGERVGIRVVADHLVAFPV